MARICESPVCAKELLLWSANGAPETDPLGERGGRTEADERRDVKLARMGEFIEGTRSNEAGGSMAAASRDEGDDREPRPTIEEISPATLHRTLAEYEDSDKEETHDTTQPKVYLLDVREPFEWAHTGVIPGSLLTGTLDPTTKWDEVMPGVDKERDEVVAVCKVGVRSLGAAATLQSAGFKKAKSLAGGIYGWILNGFEVDRVSEQNEPES
ncbi:hypothetical protein HDU93_004513 [Gonapodya sp. JEL0774]|nr:hypothetical protein HDU93_004513 [Gonapodya sp. JEL0774]